jgi:streptogramin lyase
MNKKVVLGALVAGLVVVSGALAFVYLTPQGGCQPARATQTTTKELPKTTFGAVTEYSLPASNPWANGITVAPDGSIWFGEQGIPALARFDPSTGGLVEYDLPCYPSSKIGPVSSVWGITPWNGKIWAADGDANRLIGLNPTDGSVTYLNTTTAVSPYTLAVGPQGSLWFTSLSTPQARVGRLGTDLSLTVFNVTGLGKEEPIQMQFVNGTLGYLVALNPFSSTGEGGLYSFDPRSGGGTIVAQRVGGNFSLTFPDGLSYSDGVVWVTPHYPSNIVAYDVASGSWTTYPTSTINYTYSTLPYFIQASGSSVWFNEHYHNAIAHLNASAGTMTEFSESDPPIANASQVQNDLTIALSPGRLWFTSMTGNYVGFVNASYAPGFSINADGQNRLPLAPGNSRTVDLTVDGSWSGPLQVRFSDSESLTSVPKLISITPSTGSIKAGSGPQTLSVTLAAGQDLKAGRYTVDVTVTDGLVSQTAFLFLTVA